MSRSRRDSRWMFLALRLLLVVAALGVAANVLGSLQQPKYSYTRASRMAYLGERSAVGSHVGAATAVAEQHAASLNAAEYAEQPHLISRLAVEQGRGVYGATVSNYVPLPWRAVPSVARYPATNAKNAGVAAPSYAYLVSAFLDTRRLLHGKRPQVAVNMALQRKANTQDWNCLYAVRPAGDSAAVGYMSHSKLVVAHTVLNNEPYFNYQAATSVCEIPLAVNITHLIWQAAADGGTSNQQQLYVTLVNSAVFQTANHSNTMVSRVDSDLVDPKSWVHVDVIPPLESVSDYSNTTEGSIAVCTPPLHTDAYAATLVEWAEYARLMGASQVLTYAFNPGPLIKPIIDYYQDTDFFLVHEWIIPSSILQDPGQQCKLPFFHSSHNRPLYGSPICTYHQDNYNIAWWGQVLAVQDCVYKAMVSRHRWVVVTDFDEYIVPQKASIPNWPALLNELSKDKNAGQPAMEYKFNGIKVCSGCTGPLQYTDQAVHGNSSSSSDPAQNYQPRAAAAVPFSVRRAPTQGLPDSCLYPSVGFDHILWSAIVSGRQDHVKCIIDPLAVAQAGVHGTARFSSDSLAVGIVTVPSNIAVKLHDRVHDIHASVTFATIMLPQLLLRVQNRFVSHVGLSNEVSPSDAATRTGGTLSSFWPQFAGLLCGRCASSETNVAADLQIDYSMCNLVGHTLTESLHRTLGQMQQAGTFNAWRNLPTDIANIYGGYTFDAWAPP